MEFGGWFSKKVPEANLCYFPDHHSRTNLFNQYTAIEKRKLFKAEELASWQKDIVRAISKIYVNQLNLELSTNYLKVEKRWKQKQIQEPLP